MPHALKACVAQSSVESLPVYSTVSTPICAPLQLDSNWAFSSVMVCTVLLLSTPAPSTTH